MKRLRHWLAAGILVALASTAAHAATEPVPLHAYLTASCIIADEPFYAPDGDAAKAGAPRAKFLPLIGLVVGKLAEVFITREMESSASQIKVRAARKDTLYTVISPLNLYLADGSAPPRQRQGRLASVRWRPVRWRRAWVSMRQAPASAGRPQYSRCPAGRASQRRS